MSRLSIFIVVTLLFLMIAMPTSAMSAPHQPLSLDIHVVKKNETIASVLYSRGIGKKGGKWNLYGKFGYINLVRRLNPQIKDPHRLAEGTQLVLPLPEELTGPSSEKIHVTFFRDGKNYELKWYLHKIQRNETLSGILYDYGIGTGSSSFRIFGSDRWLSRIENINNLSSEEILEVGQNLIVEVPIEIDDKTVIAPPATTVIDPLPPVIVTKETPLEVIVNLSPEEIEKLPPKLLGEKLTSEKIAKMTPDEAKKIPEGVKEDKAWDYSFLDITSEKAGSFFDGMKKNSAALYLGLRYGVSIVKPGETSLAKKLSIYGILAEFRDGPLSGARLYYDIMPTARATISGETQQIGLRRYLIGWGLGTGPVGLIDNIHVAPKFGRYKVEANLDIRESINAKPKIQELRIKDGVATGIEADLEWARFFYVLRLWAGVDTSRIQIFGKPKESVTSQRAGLDLFLKGPGFTAFGKKASLQYLLFGAKENLSLFSPQKTGDEAEILIEISFLGGGLSLSW